MSDYQAPLADMRFVLKELADMHNVAALPGYEEVSEDLVDAILDEAARFTSEVLSPLNFSGDQQGAKWNNGVVTTADGWKNAYKQYVENGWGSLSIDPQYGGQGLPKLVNAAVMEMCKSANMAFALAPMLTNGAIEAIHLRGSDALKDTYLEKMVSGQWSGTMNLTEPQAGSDLAAVRTKAEAQADGTFKVFGQKIFITYGEHDLTENIIHLVLARLPDAPEGVKGISLFVVPKFLINADGSVGARNDVHCVSIEHKLGIHASPTCVMAYGDKGGAIGYLVGELNRGLEYMFIMMNEARFGVGMEGVCLSERAYQLARQYAKDRTQGGELGQRSGEKVSIIHHPDVRRMLMLMKSQTEAMRALAYVVAGRMDIAQQHSDAAVRGQAQAFADLMIPIVKGWSTENGVDITSLGVQVHGGMGFIEETGAAQYFRDSRITTIYEGTTAIQANDFIGRKMAREGGETVKAVLAAMEKTRRELSDYDGAAFSSLDKGLQLGTKAASECVDFVLANFKSNIKATHAGSVPFLKLFGILSGGWQMARAAMVAQDKLKAGEGDAAFYQAKINTAAFYASHVMPQISSLAYTVLNGGEDTLSLAEEQF